MPHVWRRAAQAVRQHRCDLQRIGLLPHRFAGRREGHEDEEDGGCRGLRLVEFELFRFGFGVIGFRVIGFRVFGLVRRFFVRLGIIGLGLRFGLDFVIIKACGKVRAQLLRLVTGTPSER